MATFCSICVSIVVSALPNFGEERVRADDKIVQQLLKASQSAEVHAVGIYQPRNNHLDDLMIWPKFVDLLRGRKGPADRVWQLLSKETQKRVLDDDLVTQLSDPDPAISGRIRLKASVASDLRKMIDNPDLYTEKSFGDLQLSKELKEFVTLGKKRSAHQTATLNWSLLQIAFPDNIPALPKPFRTVKVQVLGGSNVVLVLCCHKACRWEVTLREGAKVTGIILCGNGAAEVVGVDAPTVYRCYYGPDGVTVAHPDDYFSAHDVKSFEYKRFVKSVKEITGKDLTAFEGKYEPRAGDEPFTIRPKAK